MDEQQIKNLSDYEREVFVGQDYVDIDSDAGRKRVRFSAYRIKYAEQMKERPYRLIAYYNGERVSAPDTDELRYHLRNEIERRV